VWQRVLEEHLEDCEEEEEDGDKTQTAKQKDE
jgi:hypothetical protein